ncbi:heparinase II/III family protein [Paeniglutamicibacter sp. ORCA_105]|uniref:heparinase II/III domain-containing protein n=1 Tax=Paeniglutamicibacter sp. ORCA_105 TaxID=3377336 RepID=UPI003896C7C8
MLNLRANNRLIGFVGKSLPHGRLDSSRSAVKLFVDERKIRLPSGKEISYDADALWEDGIDRSLARHLHGLLFLRDWPASITNDDAGEVAELAIRIINDWHAKFPAYESCSHSMAFHDETTAQRLISLIAIFEASKKYLDVTKQTQIRELMKQTSELLFDDDFHSTGNNHGMFQDIALRTYCVYNSSYDEQVDKKLETSIRRLDNYFISSFTEDGVHTENSPTYHLMITKHLAEHAEFLKLLGVGQSEQRLEGLLEQAGEYATHAVLPTGVFVPISDTQQTSISAKHHNVFGSPEFEFAATAGKSGRKPAKKYLSLPRSGYFFARKSWGDESSTFVSFLAAYNDNYHKHSDDLSLFIWHAGQPLISEAGPFGYNYQLPLTKYGFSQFSHNNIIVNGVSVPRTDKNAETVWMKPAVESGGRLTVTAGTGRLKGVHHERTVSISQDFDQIEVSDDLQSLETNKYECLWNLGKGVDVVAHGDGFELFHAGKKVADVFVETSVPVQITVHKGEMKPRPLGWNFPKFGVSEPTNTVMVTFTGQDVAVKTTFNFEDFRFTDRGLNNTKDKWNRSITSPTLNYLLDKPVRSSPHLAVVFSALAPVGNFSYNYRRTMQDLGINVLYILDDFGDQGSYYWLRRGTESVFDAVQDLIRSTMDEVGIVDAANVSTFGTSKGGTAAILHGAGLGAGMVFVGAPQFKVGSFLEAPHPNVLEYMLRGNSRAHAIALDKLVVAKLDSYETLPRIHQIVGTKDHHFNGHALHLQEYLSKRGAIAEMALVEGAPHAEIGQHYRHILPKVVRSYVEGRFESIRQFDYKLKVVSGAIELQLLSFSGNSYSCKLFNGSNLIETVAYTKNNTFVWKGLKAGRYRVRVYTKSNINRMLPFTTEWIAL